MRPRFVEIIGGDAWSTMPVELPGAQANMRLEMRIITGIAIDIDYVELHAAASGSRFTHFEGLIADAMMCAEAAARVHLDKWNNGGGFKEKSDLPISYTLAMKEEAEPSMDRATHSLLFWLMAVRGKFSFDRNDLPLTLERFARRGMFR